METKIKANDKQFFITVLPQYLPEGFEDASKVIIGVKTGEDKPSTVLLWKSSTHVYSKMGNMVAMENILSETSLIKMDVMNDKNKMAKRTKKQNVCCSRLKELGKNLWSSIKEFRKNHPKIFVIAIMVLVIVIGKQMSHLTTVYYENLK